MGVSLPSKKIEMRAARDLPTIEVYFCEIGIRRTLAHEDLYWSPLFMQRSLVYGDPHAGPLVGSNWGVPCQELVDSM